MALLRLSRTPGIGGRLDDYPEDFWVDETLPYTLSGEGEHVFLQVVKVGLTTHEAVQQLVERLGPPARTADAGIAGLKDRASVSRQWISFGWPFAADLPSTAAAPAVLDAGFDGIAFPSPGTLSPGLWVVDAVRHRHKLRTGHVRRNRFRIRLRDVAASALGDAQATLAELARIGVPNRFGPQRFGRRGDNVDQAKALLRTPRRRKGRQRLDRLLFSALQADLFNRILDLRVERGLLATALLGDVAVRHDPPAMFEVDDPEAEQGRFDRLEVSPTGPLFGLKMQGATGAAGELEREVLVNSELDARDVGRLGPGGRRPLRLPLDPDARVVQPVESELVVELTLPSGAYATVVLDELVKGDVRFRRAQSARLARASSSEPIR